MKYDVISLKDPTEININLLLEINGKKKSINNYV